MAPRVFCPPSLVDGTLARIVEEGAGDAAMCSIDVWNGTGWVRDTSGLTIREVLIAPPAGPATLKKFGVEEELS